MKGRNLRAKMKPTINMQWCPACGQQVATYLYLCDWCDWEQPDECDIALQRWNDIMDQMDRPELKNLLGFGYGCGCICPPCREKYYSHPDICPIHIATAEDLYNVIMSWAIHHQDTVQPGQTMRQWRSELSPFTKEIVLHKIELKGVEDAKTIG